MERTDVQAALEARRELGPEYEPQIVDSIVDRIEKRLEERLGQRQLPAPARPPGAVTPLILGSIGLGIPVTAVALSDAPGAGGIAVAIVAWIAIAAANLGAMFRRR
ncbi:MAG TPA: hypothetical protein VFW41_01895 [Gaiellaceae bacterium]|nr:hypothetical protein [Gaiellaceae bacterium]